MNKLLVIEFLVVLFLANNGICRYENGINWADEVVYHTDKIQRYDNSNGTDYMDSNTPSETWWLLGHCDVDQNGNGYAWDQGIDNDYAAGWKSKLDPNQSFIIKFATGIEDIDGNDLIIRLYCGPIAKASIWASEDGSSFTKIGDIEGALNQIPGDPGWLYDAAFDFNNLFVGKVNYIKVFREITEPQSGMFFDSFSSAYINYPTNANDVNNYGWSLDQDANKDCYVNLEDLAVISNYWMKDYDPNNPNSDLSLFEDANSIPSTCHGVWQSSLGLAADINKDCKVDISDLISYVSMYLECNNPQDSNCSINW